MIQAALMIIFPEADKNCKEIARMYYGGKKLLHFDETVPMLDIEALIRNMTVYVMDKHGKNYYRTLQQFSKDTKVALTEKGLPDISRVDELPVGDSQLTEKTENTGATSENESEYISPIPLICNNYYIRGIGENYSNLYKINFTSCSTSATSVQKKDSGNHKDFRKSDINSIRSQCRLFREFEDGIRIHHHQELFGLATTLVNVESGDVLFKEILKKYSYFDDRPQKYKYWSTTLKYLAREKYKPESCDKFCPYADECRHGRNILSSSKVKHHHIEVLANCQPVLVDLEVARKDVRNAIFGAADSDDDLKHIIKAATSTGKTESFLDYAILNPDENNFIAASTNILKDDIHDRLIILKLF
jgi:hypothetical protein